MLNCGYGNGFSVLDVIASVKRVSQQRLSPCAWARAGPGIPRPSWRGPSASARCSAGSPSLADLDTIVGHALGWEKRLIEYRAAS